MKKKFILYNTLTRKKEIFEPLNPPVVTLYTCGPTVYDYTHIGHMRTYTNNDVLRRALEYYGYKVNHVMNITDVGHLTDDADSGEDKLEKGAKKHKKTVWEVAEYFTDYFFKTMHALNIKRPTVVCKATDHVKEMIELIKKLEEKGYTYETDEAIYFDVSKFKDYGKLSGQSLEEKIVGAREEVHVDPQKKHPADFSLWFKRVGRFKNHTMHWDSPWGDGFPGWHIECSAMSMKYLGETIDIHAGGEDHIPVHHENEIAQSEAATDKQFVRFWFHNAHLVVDGKKMSKSLGNFYTLDDLLKRNFDPLSARLLFLQTHYRQQLNFTWQALKSSQNALENLRDKVQELLFLVQKDKSEDKKLFEKYKKKFQSFVFDDLNMPRALSVLWEVVDSPEIPPKTKLDLIYDFDEVLGLKLSQIKLPEIPKEILKLAEERKKLRKNKKFEEADKIREEIRKKGYEIMDTEKGYVIKAQSAKRKSQN